MAITKMTYNPDEVFSNATSYPDPAGETQVREQLSRPHKQVQDYINNTLIPAVESGQSDGKEYADEKITTEVKRATKAEDELSENIIGVNNKLSSEVTRAKQAEKDNSDAISSESKRASDAENVIDKKLVDISQTMAYGLAVETARAKETEKAVLNESAQSINSVSVSLSTESTRAKAAELANKNAITAENKRAYEAESTLNEKLESSNTELDRKMTDISKTVAYGMAVEQARAKASEQSLLALFNTLGLSVVDGKVCQTVKE